MGLGSRGKGGNKNSTHQWRDPPPTRWVKTHFGDISGFQIRKRNNKPPPKKTKKKRREKENVRLQAITKKKKTEGGKISILGGVTSQMGLGGTGMVKIKISKMRGTSSGRKIPAR